MKSERSLQVILSPHFSEKATKRMEINNEHVFRVLASANKAEIKEAVETLFSTKVKVVHVLNVKPKQRLFRGIKGKEKGWKKAYVTLHADQKLDIIGANS